MKKNLLLLASVVFLIGNSAYSMQSDDFNPRFPSLEKEEKKQEIVELSYGYVPLQKHDALFKTGFFRFIAAIDSFWHDKDSCANVRNAANALWNVSIVQLKEASHDNTCRDLLSKNKTIVRGTAQAAVDQAKHLYARKSESELKHMNALPIGCIMKQARINLEYVKTLHYCADVVKN